MGISRDKWHKRRATGGKRAPIRMKRRFELGRQPANTKLGERRVHRIRCRGGFMKYRALKLDHGNYAWPGEAVTRKCRILDVVYNPTNKEFVRTNTVVKGSIIQIDSTPFKNWYQKHYGVTLGKATAFVKEDKQKKLKKRSDKLAAEKKAKKDALKKDAAKKLAAKKEGASKKNAKGADKKMKAAGKKGVVAKKGEKKVVKKEAEVKKVEKKPKAATKVVAKPVVAKAEKAPKKEKKPVAEGATPKKAPKKKLSKNAVHKPSGSQVKRWRLRNATRVLEAGIAEQFQNGRLYAKVSTSPGQCGTADGYILEGEELAFYVKRMAHKKKK